MDPDPNDPRAKRTRDAILGAFTTLALSRRYDAIRTADLIAAAGIGRSTFYEHFRGKDAVLAAAAEPLLHSLASAAVGRASKVQVRAMLEHIWEQRAFARIILAGAAGGTLQAGLAARIAARLDPAVETPPAIVAAAMAAAQLAMLRLWISGAVPCSASVLARQMRACARLTAGPA